MYFSLVSTLPCIIFTALSLLPTKGYARSASLAYSVIEEAPHPAHYFTQGLVIEDNLVFESSGLYGKSFIHRLDRDNQQSIYYSLPKDQFVEGITLLNDTVYALTWKAQTLLLLDKDTLELIGKKAYKGEGWGLTTDGTSLIMSNGTNTLSFHNPDDFSIEKTITVKGIGQLNELDYHQGIIWANRWYDDRIYLISPDNGCLIGKINIRALRKTAAVANSQNVANGIAYDERRRGFWLTGKYWPKQFLITLDQPIDASQCLNHQ